MRFHLNRGPANAVNIKHGLGVTAAALRKLPPQDKRSTRAKQEPNKSYIRGKQEGTSCASGLRRACWSHAGGWRVATPSQSGSVRPLCLEALFSRGPFLYNLARMRRTFRGSMVMIGLLLAMAA